MDPVASTPMPGILSQLGSQRAALDHSCLSSSSWKMESRSVYTSMITIKSMLFIDGNMFVLTPAGIVRIYV